MKLSGLSKYDVTFAEEKVKVKNLKTGRFLSPFTSLSNNKPRWHLMTDSGNKKTVTIGQLRFMMKHPGVSADAISARNAGIQFNDDGSVSNLYGNDRNRSYATFTGIDDALNTVLFLVMVADGDKKPLLKYIDSARYNAITTVAKLLKRPYSRVCAHFNEASERFIIRVENFNVNEIKPLFAWLCKELKYVVLEHDNLHTITTKYISKYADKVAFENYKETDL